MRRAAGIALIAAAALGVALLTSSGKERHAQTRLTVGSAPARLFGDESRRLFHLFTFGEAEMTCLRASFHGHLPATEARRVSLRPTFAGHCTLSGERIETATRGCRFVVGVAAARDGRAPLDLACGERGRIAVTTDDGSCEIDVSAGSDRRGAALRTRGSGSRAHLGVDLKLAAVAYEASPACGALGVAERGLDGTYRGDTNLRAYAQAGREEERWLSDRPG